MTDKVFLRKHGHIIAPLAAIILLLGSILLIVLWLWLNSEDTISRLKLRIPYETSIIDLSQPMSLEEFTIYRERVQANLSPSRPLDPVVATTKDSDIDSAMTSERTVPAAVVSLSDADSLPIARADPALLEVTAFGSLPQVGNDGRRPWQAYQQNFVPKTGFKQIALIITNVGMNERTTLQILQTVPKEVTLAFSPYVRDADIWIARARGKGHEVLMAVPMEPTTYPQDDPGPRALRKDFSTSQNREALHWVLGRGAGYIGIIPMLGDAFTQDANLIEPILADVRARGLVFVDSTSERGISTTRARSRALLIPYANKDVIIDATLSASAITSNLRLLEELAHEQSKAVGIASAIPFSITSLNNWITSLPEKNIEIAPISYIAGQSLNR
jgi:polysaccharide deacetylase 2 family uncharacterized protein YibQ